MQTSGQFRRELCGLRRRSRSRSEATRPPRPAVERKVVRRFWRIRLRKGLVVACLSRYDDGAIVGSRKCSMYSKLGNAAHLLLLIRLVSSESCGELLRFVAERAASSSARPETTDALLLAGRSLPRRRNENAWEECEVVPSGQEQAQCCFYGLRPDCSRDRL